jgi:hypothetical protein
MDRLYDSRNVNFDLITEKVLLQKTANFRLKRTFSTDSLGAEVNKEKIIDQIKRLIYASDSFQQIEALIDHMESPDTKIDETLYSAMISSVVTTYAKNFNQSDGGGETRGTPLTY